jgi:hypothetical protein
MANQSTQKKQIESALRRGETITPMTAFTEFGCLNLSARICELITDGLIIRREWMRTPTGKRVMSYKMA